MKKHSIKLIAIAIIIVMTLAIIPFSSAALPSTWDGVSASTSFGGGDGTKVTPYLITTAQELLYLVNSVSTESYAQKYIKLTTDIDLASKTWVPIGGISPVVFSGYFDGDGHTISGLNVDGQPDNGGLFGKIDGGTIANLTVKGPLVTGTKYAGGLSALMTNGSTIINCITEIDKITCASAGGVIGRSSSGVKSYIIGCVNKSTVQTGGLGNAFTGGVIGVAGNTEISYCLNEGNVSIDDAATATYRLAGGIIGCQGASDFPADVFNCINTGNISTSPKGTYFAGGISGRVSHVLSGKVENCISTGEISVVWGDLTEKPEGKIGGLYGEVKGISTITNNYTTMDIIVGTDSVDFPMVTADNSKKLTLSAMSGNTAVTDMGLDVTYWLPMTSGIPTIDFAKIYADYLVDLETPVTTTAPITTTPPSTTVPPTTTVPQTAQPSGTTAPPSTTKAPEKTGCGKGSVIIALAQVVSVIGGAAILVSVKKK